MEQGYTKNAQLLARHCNGCLNIKIMIRLNFVSDKYVGQHQIAIFSKSKSQEQSHRLQFKSRCYLRRDQISLQWICAHACDFTCLPLQPNLLLNCKKRFIKPHIAMHKVEHCYVFVIPYITNVKCRPFRRWLKPNSDGFW